MSLDKNRPFSDKGVYDKDCNVWIFPDINADIGYKALLRLQNIIDGAETLNIKYESNDASIQEVRPVIICTTCDLVGQMNMHVEQFIEEHGNEVLPDTLAQFKKRLIVLEIVEIENYFKQLAF